MKDNFTSIVAIVDRSGSMFSLVDSTIDGFNEFLETQKREPGEAILTLATFSDQYTLVHDGAKIKEVPALNKETYVPGGTTALLDAVGRTVNEHGARLAAMAEEERPSKVLVLIMTDGAENSSREFTAEQIKDMVQHQKDKYNWEFVFIGANIDSVKTGSALGVAAASSYSYNASADGTKDLYGSITRGVSSYRKSTLGQTFSMDDPMNNPTPVPQGILDQLVTPDNKDLK